MAMDSFTGKLAVVTDGGSGMGRELSRQLTAQGCSVAACDLNPGTMAETVALAHADAGQDSWMSRPRMLRPSSMSR
jgi:NAD(P)-dependent dehydrogenase (short-subunit alcohol dehydrogenase family)